MVTLDQLPGGGRLATLVAQVSSFQPAGVESVGRGLETAASRLTAASTGVRRAVSDLATDSAGQGIDQFVTYMQPFDSGMTATVTAMNRAASLVNHVANDFATVRSEVGRIVADLLNMVPANYQSMPQSTATVAGMVDMATAQAQQVVQSRLSALKGATAQLRSLAEISPKLSDMRAPDGTPVPAAKAVPVSTHLDSAPTCSHHGYFLPAEGASDKALALFSFPSLAAYEEYRCLFGTDPDFIETNRIRDESGCVLRYERTFMRPVLPGHPEQ